MNPRAAPEGREPVVPAHTSDWRRFVGERGTGDHVVAWGSSDAFLQDLSARFLEDGLDRSELVCVVLPRYDLEAIRSRRGEDLAVLEESGRVKAVPSEDVEATVSASPDRATEIVGGFLREARREAERAGRAGVRILGRVAPLFFERREDGPAAGIEAAVQALRSCGLILCLYRTSSLEDPTRYFAAAELCRAHTHSLVELPGGPVVCETRAMSADAG
jgi:hypothetical protein